MKTTNLFLTRGIVALTTLVTLLAAGKAAQAGVDGTYSYDVDGRDGERSTIHCA